MAELGVCPSCQALFRMMHSGFCDSEGHLESLPILSQPGTLHRCSVSTASFPLLSPEPTSDQALRCCCSLSHVQLFATPGTVPCWAPLSMGFSRQEYQSRLPFSSPGLAVWTVLILCTMGVPLPLHSRVLSQLLYWALGAWF